MGSGGEVSRVVIDPSLGRSPISSSEPKTGKARQTRSSRFVDATKGEVRLGLHRAEFDKLGAAEETQFVPGSRYAGYSPGQVLAWPFYSLMGNASRPPPTTPSPWRGVRTPRRPSPCDDGDIGRVQGNRHRPSQSPRDPCAPPRRHLWGSRDVAIPIRAVTGVDDGIGSNITKQQVQDLPPVDIDHPTG